MTAGRVPSTYRGCIKRCTVRLCLSVQCLRFSRNRKAVETCNLVQTYRCTRVTRGKIWGLTVKGQGHCNENVKIVFAHIFVKSGSIYVKPRSKVTRMDGGSRLVKEFADCYSSLITTDRPRVQKTRWCLSVVADGLTSRRNSIQLASRSWCWENRVVNPGTTSTILLSLEVSQCAGRPRVNPAGLANSEVHRPVHLDGPGSYQAIAAPVTNGVFDLFHWVCYFWPPYAVG